MFLQTGMTNRRQFLERSALGVGSLLFSSGLLSNCTDHTIPDPNPPINPWPVLDTEIDWNDKAKILVKTGLELIPEAGDILGPLAELFWPKSKEDVWGQVREQTEKLVDQKIDTLVYQQVSDDLTGLKNVLDNYQLALHPTDANGNPAPVDYERVRTYWRAADDFLGDKKPHFQTPGYELSLLGLFTQFANMYLATYRDGVAFGKSWGFEDSEVGSAATKLKSGISDFTTYTTLWYEEHRGFVLAITKPDPHACEPFRTVNAYDRQMAFTVLDYRDTWPYFDVTKYPTGTTVKLTREIYSDPMGTCDNSTNSGGIVIPTPVPTQLPTNLTVWSGDRVDAVQLTYPAGSGPGGVTQTPRMGAKSGSSNTNDFVNSINISPDNPIVQARLGYGDVVGALAFRFNDGTTTAISGGKQGENDLSTTIGYYYELVSNVYIHGMSYFYACADCIVIGFQHWTPPSAALKAIRALYVASPKERSTADFAKAFPGLAIPADLITDELKAVRQAYWAYIQARAKGPK